MLPLPDGLRASDCRCFDLLDEDEESHSAKSAEILQCAESEHGLPAITEEGVSKAEDYMCVQEDVNRLKEEMRRSFGL